MDATQAQRRALDLHRNGYHCGEAVLVAVLEAAKIPLPSLIPRVATGFGGGVGRSRAEICGALAGGLMAIGCLCGRDRQGESWEGTAQVAAQLREQFLKRHASTCCADILEALGPQQDQHLCKELSGTTAELTCQILNSAVAQKIVALAPPSG